MIRTKILSSQRNKQASALLKSLSPTTLRPAHTQNDEWATAAYNIPTTYRYIHSDRTCVWTITL